MCECYFQRLHVAKSVDADQYEVIEDGELVAVVDLRGLVAVLRARGVIRE